MPRDNVTPFRRPPRRPPPRQPGGNPLRSHRGKAVLVHVLTLAAFGVYAFARFFLTGSQDFLVTLVGLAFGIGALLIAAANRYEGMPWAVTHHEHGLRTIVIGAAAWTLISLLGMLPGAGIFVYYALVAVAAWVALRAIVDLVLAVMRRRVPNPKSLLF